MGCQSIGVSLQCRKAVAKAMSVLGIVKQNLMGLDVYEFSILYKNYIRPAWSIACKDGVLIYNGTDCLEKVQQKAYKLSHGAIK
jgi:hypothetical protein